MRPGQVIEAAIWLTGTETQELRDRYMADVHGAMALLCAEHNVTHGPLHWTEKRPGEDRVPRVPDHVSGPDVRLWVAEAPVTGILPEVNTRGFIGELERQDLERLRAITRRRWAETHPGQTLTDMEADDVIEQLGPGAALETLRANVSVSRFH